MGVDLRLLPVDCLSSTWGYSHTVLNVPRMREMWPDIEALAPAPVPDGLNISSFVGKRVPDGSSEGEIMYGPLRATDSYGTPYTWIRAAPLRPVLAKFIPTHPVTAYLNALDGDTLVILDWH